MSFKTSLLSVAVLLTLSSCGKNKELKTPAAGAEKPAAESTIPQANPNVDEDLTDRTGSTDKAKDKNKDKDKDKDKDKHTDETKDNDKDADQDRTSEKDEPRKGRPKTVRPKTDESKSHEPKTNAPKKDVTVSGDQKNGPVKHPTAPVENKPAVATTGLVKDVDVTKPSEKTGGKSGDLFYTGAGNDGLMNEFKAKSAAVSAEQQHKNLRLASSIAGARLSKSIGQDLIVDLAIKENTKGATLVKNYRFKTQPAGDMLKLSMIGGTGGALEFKGGYLKCLDLDGACENSYAKINLSGAITRVIFRKSAADTYFLTQKAVARDNQGYSTMKFYITNTYAGSVASQQIDNVKVSSYEVVNGSAAMGVALTMTDKEMVGLSFPLLVSNSGSAVNVPVAKVSDLSKSYDLAIDADATSQISSLITNASLVANNGQGQTKVKLFFESGANSGSIWLVMSKVPKKTMSIEQVRAFEATVNK